jgi:SAM-dependent methyltransferase
LAFTCPRTSARLFIDIEVAHAGKVTRSTDSFVTAETMDAARYRWNRRYRSVVTDEFTIVRAGYDAIAGRYRDASHANPVRLYWIDRLLAMLSPGSVVVDLGCGPGDPATRLIAERHHVIGVDGSAEQLALAQTVAPTALLVQADMTRFALRPDSVDAVASFYALGHVPSRLHGTLLASVSSWLRPGGVLVASAPVTVGDDSTPAWLGTPMFFGGIGEAATREALEAAGLSIKSIDVVEENETDDKGVRFMWIVATKNVE